MVVLVRAGATHGAVSRAELLHGYFSPNTPLAFADFHAFTPGRYGVEYSMKGCNLCIKPPPASTGINRGAIARCGPMYPPLGCYCMGSPRGGVKGLSHVRCCSWGSLPGLFYSECSSFLFRQVRSRVF